MEDKDIFEISVPSSKTYTSSMLSAVKDRMHKSLESIASLSNAADSAHKYSQSTSIKLRAECKYGSVVSFESMKYGIKVSSPWLGTVWLKKMPLRDAILEAGMLTVEAFRSGDWAVKYDIVCPFWSNVFFKTAETPYMVLKNIGVSGASYEIGLPDSLMRDITFATMLAPTRMDSPADKIHTMVSNWISAATRTRNPESFDVPLTDKTAVKIGDVLIENIIVDLPSAKSEKMVINGEALEVATHMGFTTHNRRPASRRMSEIAKMLLNACNDIKASHESMQDDTEELDI